MYAKGAVEAHVDGIPLQEVYVCRDGASRRPAESIDIAARTSGERAAHVRMRRAAGEAVVEHGRKRKMREWPDGAGL